MINGEATRSLTAGDRAAGIALVAAAAGSVLAMAHHPSGGHAGPLGGIVHGAMIALIATMAFGFAHFALRRGLARPAILAGLVAFAVSLFGHVGAATINGFVVPALAGRGHGAAGHDIFLFAWESNQALARLGVFATGTAFVLWSLDLLRERGAARWLGAAGLVAGAMPAVLLGGGWIAMNVAGAFLVYAAHAAWTAAVGAWMVTGGLEREPEK